MKKSVIGILGAALILTMGTAGTLCAETVQSGTVPQSVVRQSVTRQSTVQSGNVQLNAQLVEEIRAGRNNICNYAGTFHDYGNCTGDCRNYIDENQNGVCDNYEVSGRQAWKERNTQVTQATQDTQDTQSTQDTGNISSARYTYGYGGHHGEQGGHHGSGSGYGRHGGCGR